MVPPSWNERDQVETYAARLARDAIPAAVTVSILDVCTPAVEHAPDYHTHWTLTHFLLDGHHKIQTAAETVRPVRLLYLSAVDACLTSPEQVAQLPTLLGASPTEPNPATTPRTVTGDWPVRTVTAE